MPPIFAFLSPTPLPVAALTAHRILPRCTSRRSAKRLPSRPVHVDCPCMIQSPYRDGPPDLEAFFDKTKRSLGSSGPPVSLSTGRALISANGTAETTALSALRIATEGLENPQLCHVTFSPSIDADTAVAALRAALPAEVTLFARSVNKKDAEDTVEVLLLRSEAKGGISVAYATVDVTEGADGISNALLEAAEDAAATALEKLHEPCTFLVFSHSPGGRFEAARKGLDNASPGVVAYGGPAVGDSETGAGWALTDENGDICIADVADKQTVQVAAVPGSLSFLVSAVVKSWAQPAYSEPLSFMTPNYIDDPQVDLLTAIRYNDWEKFIWCIEDQGVDVNTKWENKQNQSPLLAACARARTEILTYLLEHGADVHHRNDGGFTAAMYTRMLTEYDRDLILKQLKMLEDAGARTTLSPDEVEKLKIATSGKIVE